MGRPRGVKVGEIVRLDLSDGDWIDVKNVISAKEANRIKYGSIAGMRDQRMEFNEAHIAYLAAATYIVGWSLTDLDGNPRVWLSSLERRIAALEDLDEATFNEIDAALTKHRKGQDEAREKNVSVTGNGEPSSLVSAN